MYGTSFKVYQFISLALIGNTLAYGAYDFSNLNNLGDQITRHVNQQLAPLQNLGARISADVNRQLEPLRSGKFYTNVYSHVDPQPVVFQQPFIPPPQPFLGANLELSRLDNLGQQIQQSVYEGLEPVRALEITMKMKNGVGGVTLATHQPEGRKFVIINNKILQCNGSISEEDGKCYGTLNPFKINEKKDYCYDRHGFSIINNKVCVGATTVSIVNDEIKCLSNTGTPALLVTVDEFKKLCEAVSTSVDYKYIANPDDVRQVVIPSKNKYVKCKNNEPGVCVFTESNALPSASKGSIFIAAGTHVFG